MKLVQIIDPDHEYFGCTGVAGDVRKSPICVYLNEDVIYVTREQLEVLTEREHMDLDDK